MPLGKPKTFVCLGCGEITQSHSNRYELAVKHYVNKEEIVAQFDDAVFKRKQLVFCGKFVMFTSKEQRNASS